MISIEFQIGKDRVLFRSSDYSGYELCYLRTQKDEQVWTPEKFFASIGQALQRVMEMKVRAADVRTLAELKAAIEKARADVVEVYQLKPDIAG
jgi:hypothetical protein